MVNQPFIRPAEFFDGESAKRHQVTVTSSGAALTITYAETGQQVSWRLGELRRIKEQAQEAGLILTSTDQPEARLRLFDIALCREIERNAPNLSKEDAPKGVYRRLALWGGGAMASVLLIVFVIIPMLANTLATLIPMDREVALGKIVVNQVEDFLRFEMPDEFDLGTLRDMADADEPPSLACEGPKGRAAIEKMTARIMADYDGEYDLKIKVFDHPMVNAFAAPGGHIVLLKGLLTEATSPEEVAGVLAHEIGHVENRDSTRAILRTTGTAGILGMLVGDFAGGAAVLIATEQLVNAAYSQEAERVADVFTHDRFAEAHLPAEAFAAFFDRLREEHGDTEGVMSHLASHPDMASRAEAARAADTVEGAFEPVLTDAEWADLQGVCDEEG